MNILGLDPANRTGFCHSDGYRGVVEIDRTLDKHRGARLVRFQEWLEETLDNHPTELLAAEDASFGSPNPSVQAMHNELRGMIFLVAAERLIDVKLFQPSSIKLHATGHGNSNKAAMVRAAQRYFKITETDQDVIDAMWVCDLAARPDCWPEPKVKKPKRVKTLPPQRRFRFGR